MERMLDEPIDECTHENVEWYSGEPNVIIALNGDAFAKCLDCGEEAFISEQEWDGDEDD